MKQLNDNQVSAIGAHAVAIRLAAEMLHLKDETNTVEQWMEIVLKRARVRYSGMSSSELGQELERNLEILRRSKS
jgi:ribosome-binding protein aMBF1 (putative translation factor)